MISTSVASPAAHRKTTGTILRTTDGGETWTFQASRTGNHLFGVSFVDANTGTAVGDLGIVLRTMDGGETWR